MHMISMNEPRLLPQSSAASVRGNEHVLKSNNTFLGILIGNPEFLGGGQCKRQKMNVWPTKANASRL
jgi:hypothetical protein